MLEVIESLKTDLKIQIKRWSYQNLQAKYFQLNKFETITHQHDKDRKFLASSKLTS